MFSSAACIPLHTPLPIHLINGRTSVNAKSLNTGPLLRRHTSPWAPSQPDDAHCASCNLVHILVRQAGLVYDSPPSGYNALLSANMSTRKDMRGRQDGTKVRDMATHHERKLSAGMAQASAIATARRPTEWQRGRDRFRGLARENRRSIF